MTSVVRSRALLALSAVVLAAACTSAGQDVGRTAAPSSSGGPSASASRTPSGQPVRPSVPTEAGVTVVAAGDIACPDCSDRATAGLAASLRPELVLALGDLQYESGAYEDFRRDYDSSWGRFKSITRPVPGNHEYDGGSAPGYYRYFGSAAGNPRHGWYSFDVGGWHLVGLNSNCGGGGVNGCGPGSPQLRWLAADLAASATRGSQPHCTLAYWHQPRFSSGLHGSDAAYDAFWRELHASGAELVLSGHDHHFERFAPLDPEQQVDLSRGVRQFVVGTGGRTRYPVFFAERGSEARLDSAYGVLHLTLRPGSYDWRFVTVAGGTADAGSGRCH